MFGLFLEFRARTCPQDLWPFLNSETELKFLIWTQGEIRRGNPVSPVNRAHVKKPQARVNSRNFATPVLVSQQKWSLSNERRNSILMTSHYQDLGSASAWSCGVGNLFLANQRLRRHKYGSSAWTRSPRLKLGSFSIDDGNGRTSVLKWIPIFSIFVVFIPICWKWQV